MKNRCYTYVFTVQIFSDFFYKTCLNLLMVLNKIRVDLIYYNFLHEKLTL